MKPYKVRKSKIDNFGLYAAKDIKKGSRIIEYKGKVITTREAERNGGEGGSRQYKKHVKINVLHKIRLDGLLCPVLLVL